VSIILKEIYVLVSPLNHPPNTYKVIPNGGFQNLKTSYLLGTPLRRSFFGVLWNPRSHTFLILKNWNVMIQCY